MREILLSILLLFSFSLSVQAQAVTASPDWDVQQIEVGHDSVNVAAQPHSPERLFNVTGESTQPSHNEHLTLVQVATPHKVTNNAAESQLPFEVGW